MPSNNDASAFSQNINPMMTAWNVVSFFVFMACTIAGAAYSFFTHDVLVFPAGLVLGWILAQSPKTVDQWEKAVILRLGRYAGMRGPGLFWVIPFLDTVKMVIDERTLTTSFTAKQTLTADTVPVNVDAVLFWQVHDTEKAALSLQNYGQAISWAAQTALRAIIGRTSLAELLCDREKVEADLQSMILERASSWGLTVQSVEMHDVVIPDALQDAMSREAQAEREKRARIILGESEVEIAQKFFEAAKSYENNPTALHLRAMNMLYEGLKEKGALMIVPSSAVESMSLGGFLGAAAMRQKELLDSSTEPT